MDKTISHLVSIVKNAKTRKAAAQEISNAFSKLSPSAALVVVKDVEDYMGEETTKTQLALFLVQAGL